MHYEQYMFNKYDNKNTHMSYINDFFYNLHNNNNFIQYTV